MKAVIALFGRSPFRPIQAHMEKARACVERIEPLITAYLDGDTSEFERFYREIYDLESEADDIKNDIRSHLPRSLFLPIDRRDLLEILAIIDEIADTSQDIGTLLTLRRLAVHPELREPVMQLVREVAKVCFEAADIIRELDELVESSFGGKEADKVLRMIERLNADETVADGIGLVAARKLFELEGQLSAIDVMLWLRLLEEVGELANTAERMGNRLRLLIAK